MTGFSPQVKQLMRDRALMDGLIRCEVMAVCQGSAASLWQAHHRRPRGAGGSKRPETNQAANGLLVCGDDHRFIEANRETALRNGWLVRQNQTPSEIPVLYRHRWVLLSDDGSVTEADCVCGEIGSDGWYPGVCVCVEEA